MAEPVVSRALVRILQDFVGFIAFLETDLAFLVAGIAIGMMLHRRLAEGGFQFDFGAGARDTQHLIVIALRHQLLSPQKQNLVPRTDEVLFAP